MADGPDVAVAMADGPDVPVAMITKTQLHGHWPYTLSGRIGKVVVSHAAVARSSPAEVALIYTMHEALRGLLLMTVGGVTSQLDPPSLTPLSVAGCG